MPSGKCLVYGLEAECLARVGGGILVVGNRVT